MKISLLRGYPTFWNKNSVSFLTELILSAVVWENRQIFWPRYATISLVPYAEGHKPKRNEHSSSYAVTSQQTATTGAYLPGG